LDGVTLRESPAAPHRTRHLRYLDSLRGIAILGVILVHSGGLALSKSTGILHHLSFSGQRGVQLFYVISAFTLCYSFDVRPKAESHPLANYFVRRFFRIAPLYYLAIIGNVLINGLGPSYYSPQGLTPLEILSGFLFLNGFHPHTINSIALGGWSIAVETSFYVVLPLILAFVNTARRALLLLLIGGILAPTLSHFCFSFFQVKDWSEYFYFFWFPIEFPVFCLGICAYYLGKEYGGDRLPAHPKVVSLLLLLTAALIFLTSLPITNGKLYWSTIAFVPLILGLSLWEWRALVNPITVFLGKISYSLYLMHFFCLIPIRLVWYHICHVKLPGYNPEDTLGGLAFIFITLLLSSVMVATVTNMLVEKPGIRWGRDLIQRWEKAAVSARI
jgi:peptidoglycan/LPS O-acetylase OafA/YrhL